MKKTFLFIISLMIMQGLFAQNDGSFQSKKNEIGVHAGSTTGIGLSYRFWPGKFGFQLTALPIKQDDELWVSGGLTFLYKFYDAKYVRVFGYLGNHYQYDNSKVYEYNYHTGTSYLVKDENSKYNIGIGPGFEFGSTVRFNIMLGYGAYDILGEFNLLPAGEIGLYYNF